MKNNQFIPLIFLLFLVACQGYSTPSNLRLTDLSIIQLRAMQIRQFDQLDITQMMSAMIKTLANLDFQIVRVDSSINLIEAIRLENNNIMQANVIITKLSVKGLTTIRVVLRYNQNFVTSPQTYQDFFDTLSHFLS